MRHLVLENEETVKDNSSIVQSHISNDRIGDADEFNSEIVNLAYSIDDKAEKREHFFSLELFPSRKADKEAYESFFTDINRYMTPLFYALTWHENLTSGDTYLPLEILKSFPTNTLLHIAANNLKNSDVLKILNEALVQGKTNLFVLRGDNCSGIGDFTYALDLVKFIKQHYHSKFTICVAGYPQMHPESTTKKMDLYYLKEKVDAGADFIITQIFFESKVFVDFVRDCRRYDISVPIIPGIFPIPNFKSVMRMAKLCSVEIPQMVLNELQSIQEDDDTVCNYGISLARKLITEIFESGAANGFHLFTLNRAAIALDVCRGILEQ